MTDNVFPLGASRIESDRKALFLERLGAAYDAYVHRTGAEPDAIMHALGGIREPVSIGWHTCGHSLDHADAFLARVGVSLTRELLRGD